jgi:hypothetical protein
MSTVLRSKIFHGFRNHAAPSIVRIGSSKVTCQFAQTKQGETPMKSLVSRAMYHPFIALSMFYLTDLMFRADYSPSGALLVLAAKTMSRLLRLLNKG